ncbi:MAG: phospholipase D-like domain-containing protein [Bacteroidota bacterium]
MSDITELLLKQHLKDVIDGREVKAALFYTFNFSPRFFENYVMPLLVPQQRFINNEITNHIVWRNLYKEKRVPPVTVFFDHDAKDSDSGPMLDYDFNAVRMPSVGRNKGNFHPKNSFILAVNNRGEEELIVLTGSNNITQNGWCENIECVALLTLVPGNYYPYELCRSYKEFIKSAHDTFGGKDRTVAEELIIKSLNRNQTTNQTTPFFYHPWSGHAGFDDFLEAQIFSKRAIYLAEIQSPYFSSDTALVDKLTARGIQVRIEAPIRNGIVQLDAKTYDTYFQKGVAWHLPMNDTRNSHRKVYRFHATDRVFTVVGSVNFTKPAWNAFDPEAVSNIETAMVFEQKIPSPQYLLYKAVRKDQLRFEDPVSLDEDRFERLEVPDIRFEMDWIGRKLSWITKAKHPCSVLLPDDSEEPVVPGSYVTFPLNPHGNSMLDALARKPLLTVKEERDGITYNHLYYMTQNGFEQRPSQFRITTSDMIDAWDLLGKDDDAAREWLESMVEGIVENLQDESGRIDSCQPESKSLLNDMARHFYGLSRLEEYLFDEDKLKGSEKSRSRHYFRIAYYLSHDNVDTLVNYIRGLDKLHAEGALMHSYYWLLLQIVRVKFYEHPELKKFIKSCVPADSNEEKNLRRVIGQRLSMLEERIQAAENQIPGDKKLLNWALHNLQTDHELS